MNHFYKTIPGMFDYEDLYRDMVNHFHSPARFVEIGVYMGRSAMFMAVEIFNSRKHIKFDVVDSWEFTDDIYEDHLFPNKNKAFKIFLNNSLKLPKGILNYHKMTSEEASKKFLPESLDFVFIDGSHAYEFVKLDLACWYPKVKPGGIIAGHDKTFEGVKQAVDEFFMDQIVEEASINCWLVRK